MIAKAVLCILAKAHNGEATLPQLRKEIPKYVKLTAEDMKQSDTRPNEEMWEQILRNIVSHKKVEGNIIAEGLVTNPSKGTLKITDAGLVYAKNNC